MARPLHALLKLPLQTFEPLSTTCLVCGNAAHIAYHTERTVATLTGRHHLRLAVCRCISPECPRCHRPYRPEAVGAWALPHEEYGLDVIALVGSLRYRHHQSLAEIHQSLHERGLSIGEQTVFNLLARYEELVTLHMTDQEHLQSLVRKQGSLILAVDGLKPDVGHEVLWVVRDCISGELLLARPLLSEREVDLVTLGRSCLISQASEGFSKAELCEGRRLKRTSQISTISRKDIVGNSTRRSTINWRISGGRLRTVSCGCLCGLKAKKLTMPCSSKASAFPRVAQ